MKEAVTMSLVRHASEYRDAILNPEPHVGVIGMLEEAIGILRFNKDGCERQAEWRIAEALEAVRKEIRQLDASEQDDDQDADE